jgi:hypothetical protein
VFAAPTVLPDDPAALQPSINKDDIAMNDLPRTDPRATMRAAAEAAGMEMSQVEKFFGMTEFDPDTGCLLWKGALTPAGYGSLRFSGRNQYAHRLACEMLHGPWTPERPLALHRCNRPKCVNAEHLRPGTPAENMADAVTAGTAGRPRGRVLSDRQTAEVTGLQLMGWNGTEIRSETGISAPVINEIRHGRYRPDAISNELDKEVL